MNIYIYSDESGVFDKVHNDIYVFGGLILLGNDSKQEWSQRYSAAEKIIREKRCYSADYELKATNLINKDKSKLYRSLNNYYKFGVVINQKRILDRIYTSKKDKQRYLDYAYKIAVKKAFVSMIDKGIIEPSEVERLYFCVDEHTTATNGCYELSEALEQEFRNGTFNGNYSIYYPPIFKEMKEVVLQFCNSKAKLLVRAADIVANKIYYIACNNGDYKCDEHNLHMTFLP